MKIRCVASEPVTIPVTQSAVPIQHYLRQPHRLVHAIADPKLMDVLGRDRYRLRMNPLNLLNLYHFQPTVVLKVQADSQGVVSLCSESCTIQGIDYINDRFSLAVKGELKAIEKGGKTYLRGDAIARVTVDIPPFLILAPLPILEAAGDQLVKSVLGRIKERLLSHLIADYQTWAADAPTENLATSTLSPLS